MIIRSCQVCDSTRTLPLREYTTTEWQVVQCVDCRFVYLQSAPEYEALDNEYAWDKTFEVEWNRRKKRRFAGIESATRWRLKLGKLIDERRRRRTVGLSGNVLDVGCGGDIRIPPGPRPFGVEISAALAQRAAPHFEARGGRVVQAPAIEGMAQFNDGFFDAIVMRSYLEHEVNVRDALTTAHAKLKNGGRIFIRTPNFACANRILGGSRWCGWRFPDHVNYFAPATLRRLCRRAGFQFKHLNKGAVFDDNIAAELIKPAGS